MQGSNIFLALAKRNDQVITSLREPQGCLRSWCAPRSTPRASSRVQRRTTWIRGAQTPLYKSGPELTSSRSVRLFTCQRAVARAIRLALVKVPEMPLPFTLAKRRRELSLPSSWRPDRTGSEAPVPSGEAESYRPPFGCQPLSYNFSAQLVTTSREGDHHGQPVVTGVAEFRNGQPASSTSRRSSGTAANASRGFETNR
jgi:hypothetical protein